MNLDKSFLLEKFKALRAEILYLVRQSYLFEAAILVAVGAIYSWLFSINPNNVNQLVWWLPFGIIILGAIRELGVRLRLLQLAEYIRVIEPEFFNDEACGWKHFFILCSKEGEKHYSRYIVPINMVDSCCNHPVSCARG